MIPRALVLAIALVLQTRADELAQAREHLQAGRAREAIVAIDDALETRPEDPTAWLLRAAAHEALGDLEAAVADHGERVRLEPRSAAAWLERARLRARRGDAAGALEDVERALALGAKDTATRALQATLLLEKGRAREAVRALSGSREPGQERLLARARACAGDLAGALTELDRRLERAPEDARARFDRGRLRALKGDLSGAREDLERSGAAPGEVAAWSVLLGAEPALLAPWHDVPDRWLSLRARWIATDRGGDALLKLAASAPEEARRARLREAHLLRAIARRTAEGVPDRAELDAAIALGLFEP